MEPIQYAGVAGVNRMGQETAFRKNIIGLTIKDKGNCPVARQRARLSPEEWLNRKSDPSAPPQIIPATSNSYFISHKISGAGRRRYSSDRRMHMLQP